MDHLLDRHRGTARRNLDMARPRRLPVMDRRPRATGLRNLATHRYPVIRRRPASRST